MAGFNSAKLQKRILSALILAPFFLALVWYGGWPFIAIILGIFTLAIYEWHGVVSKLPKGRLVSLIIGVFYITASFYSFYLCRDLGLAHIFLLLFMVWSSDIGAYFAGKIIGGPKLMPQVSPNKTWAGLAGALLSPFLVLLVFIVLMTGGVTPFLLALLLVAGAVIGLTGQAGDLLISFMKRQAGVKDTGSLIPGHGGILDRIDSLLLVTPVFYVLVKSLMIVASML